MVDIHSKACRDLVWVLEGCEERIGDPCGDPLPNFRRGLLSAPDIMRSAECGEGGERLKAWGQGSLNSHCDPETLKDPGRERF